jgi:4-amino-4-deoxy-L-arabinose transferase-like glycosyltransferase
MQPSILARGQAWAAGAAVVLIAGLVRIPPLAGPLHDDDEGVYWQSLRSLDHGHRLFSDVYSSQPPAFLGMIEPFYALLGRDLTAARVGVLTISLLGVAAGMLAVAELAGRSAGLLAGVLLALDPLMLRESVTLQSDEPAVALALVALAFAARSRRASPRSRAMLAGAAGAALAVGVLTKLLAAGALPAVALLAAAPALGLSSEPRRSRARTVLSGLAPLAIGGVLAALVILAPFHDRLVPLFQQSIGLHVASHTVDEGGFPEVRGALVQGLPLLALAVAGVVVAVRRMPLEVVALTLWVLAGALLLPLQHPLWPHHLTGTASALCLMGGLLGAGVGAQRAAWFRRPATWLAGACACALAGVMVATWLRLAHDDGSTAADARRLGALLPPGSQVVTDDQATAAAAGLDTPPGLVDTSLVRIFSGDLRVDQVEASAAATDVGGVFFGTTRLDHLPGFRAWVTEHFPVSAEVAPGRAVYLRG